MSFPPRSATNSNPGLFDWERGWSAFLLPFGLSLVLIFYLEAAWWLNQNAFSLRHLGFSFVVSFFPLLWVNILNFQRISTKNKAEIGVLAVLVCCNFLIVLYSIELTPSFLVWVVLAVILARTVHSLFRSRWASLLAGLLFAGVMSLGLAGVSQLIKQFSDEEFFVGVELVSSAGWCFLFWLLSGWMLRYRQIPGRLSLPFAPVWIILPTGLAFLALSYLIYTGYQGSFAPKDAPIYAGISSQNPFLCGPVQSTADSQTYQGGKVFDDLVTQIASNPNKRTFELGMLAYLSEDPRWADEFHQAILQDARSQLYTGPANSVKYGQYLAAQTFYDYLKVVKKYSGLFSEGEQKEISDWFAAANRRATTVEWVDWMYALALGEWPKGPYMNQENGAGFLALLESQGASTSNQSQQNRAFLDTHAYGWLKRFRNTDNSISYQVNWINNAFFESLYFNNSSQSADVLQRRDLAFQWLLLQAAPDGSPVGYNPEPLSLAGTAYLGAQLTGRADLLWLAGRSLEYAKETGESLWAQPGITGPLNLNGTSPNVGSCLIYGDSGMPNQVGPLAPDKIIFRSGWDPADSYMALNLRFTGWHRYKASNSVISIYSGEPLVVEQTNGAIPAWLPVGRSAFRDKRIPRENLNGLVIEKSGIAEFVYLLTGVGGRWAQDIPYYAQVDKFTPGEKMDQSVTTLTGWDGWTQTRSITFVHHGPILISDTAFGKNGDEAGITWHVITPATPAPETSSNRIRIGQSGKSEMVLLYSSGEVIQQAEQFSEGKGISIRYQSDTPSEVQLVTVILNEAWSGAKVQQSGANSVTITKDGQTLTLPIH